MRSVCHLAVLLICLGMVSLSTGCRASNGWAMNKSGRAHYNRGNYAAARSDFARAVADDPYHPDYRHNLAMAMAKQGDAVGAEQVLRHNLSLDPMHQPTYHALAQNLIQQQRTTEAQELLAEWTTTQPYVTESHIEMAWLQRELGNHAGAEHSLRQALQVEPNNPVALAQMGQVYHDTGRGDQAASLYKRSLASRWSQPEVKARLANMSGRRERRSAMAQNSELAQPITFAQGPMIMDQSALAAMPLDGDPALSRRELRHAHRHAHEPLASFPVDGLGASVPTLAAPQPIIADQTIVTGSPLAAQPEFSPPSVASGPALSPQADPAHTTEQTAGLPVVDPH